MKDELGRIWKEVVVAKYMRYSLREKRNLSANRRCLGRDWNPALPEHKQRTTAAAAAAAAHSACRQRFSASSGLGKSGMKLWEVVEYI
jgi:hypothetical protein